MYAKGCPQIQATYSLSLLSWFHDSAVHRLWVGGEGVWDHAGDNQILVPSVDMLRCMVLDLHHPRGYECPAWSYSSLASGHAFHLWLSCSNPTTLPRVGKKKLVKPVLKLMVQLTFFLAGFLAKVKGKKATQDKAPIFITAPHSTFFDSIPCVMAGLPSMLSASQNVQIPLTGKFLLSTQLVLVIREDPNSRKNTKDEILKWVTFGKKWPQILIFPEGVCINRSHLVTFKLGDFCPGVPV